MDEQTLQQIFGSFGLLFIVLMIWSVIWKGIALWKAGRKNHLVWFVVMFIINTAGILEILYIFVFSKMKKSTLQEMPKQTPPQTPIA